MRSATVRLLTAEDTLRRAAGRLPALNETAQRGALVILLGIERATEDGARAREVGDELAERRALRTLEGLISALRVLL